MAQVLEECGAGFREGATLYALPAAEAYCCRCDAHGTRMALDSDEGNHVHAYCEKCAAVVRDEIAARSR